MKISTTSSCSLVGAVSVVLFLLAGSAFAYPTSNQFIPTADILPAGQVRLEYENDAYSRLFNKDLSQNFLLSQAGLSKRLEVGIDAYDFTNDTIYAFNAKYLLVPETRKGPAIAVGIVDVARGVRPTLYTVATKAWGTVRGHLGAIHSSGDTFGIVGTDYKVNEKLYLLADWTTGPNGYLTAGVYQKLPVKPELWINVGVGRPNISADSNLALVNLSYFFNFKE